ncbi:hypothetical protein BDZ45DRAFT_151277 [Acephala macrosclerotiorum]|nr:hypothetical protein BDZ45DRAFT_151277 [Acephala macrosclerotiorum]
MADYAKRQSLFLSPLPAPILVLVMIGALPALAWKKKKKKRLLTGRHQEALQNITSWWRLTKEINTRDIILSAIAVGRHSAVGFYNGLHAERRSG